MATFRRKPGTGDQATDAHAAANGDGWQRLRTRCLPISLARQRRLIDSGAGGPWQLDLERGMATIGGQETTVQVLGNSSESSQSFMFGWHLCEVNGFDQRWVQAAHRARAAAGDDRVRVFSGDTLSTTDVDEAELASVMAVLGSDAAMYRGPHSDGAIYFTLEDFDITHRLPTEAVMTVAASCVELGIRDHRTALGALFEYERFDVTAGHDGMYARRDRDLVVVSFDGEGRATEFRVTTD